MESNLYYMVSNFMNALSNKKDNDTELRRLIYFEI